MTVSAEDLDVFILTRNRADLLKKTIESLIQQTLSGITITILDNASTDHTAQVVKSFNSPKVRIVSAKENLGALGNFQRSQQLASRKYIMIFHDDDQLHPEYLKTALTYLDANPDTALLAPNKINIKAGETPSDSYAANRTAIKLNKTLFSALLFIKNKLAFPGVIYRTDCWKTVNIEAMFGQFGKWADRPIMTESLMEQSAIILNGAFVYYGRHEAQDTHTKETQPPHTLWLKREQYFKDILGDKLTTFPGRCFCTMSHRRLKSGYKRRIIKDMDFKTYLLDAFTIGATTKKAWRFRFISFRPLQGIFHIYANMYLRRHCSITVPDTN